MDLSRRSFVSGAALAAAAMGSTGFVGRAMANEVAQYIPSERSIAADVAVVGLGTSGLICAAAAADKGARVVAVDSAETMSLTTNCLTSGAWCVESSEQKKHDGYLTKEEAYNYILKGANYINSAVCLRSIMENSGPAVDILIDGGMPFVFPFEGATAESPMLSRGGHVYNADAETRAGVFESILQGRGVDYHMGMTAQMLIIQDGKVAGVQCVDSEGTIDILAPAVCMCSGGFLANEEMVREHYAGAYIYPIGPGNSKGAGIKMAQSAGGQLGKNFSISMNDWGGCNPKSTDGLPYAFKVLRVSNEILRFPVLGGLIVDDMGERFIDESRIAEETMYTAEPMIRNSHYYCVLDDAMMQTISTTEMTKLLGNLDNATSAIRMLFEGFIIDDVYELFDRAVEEGWAYKADSIDELAEVSGLANLSVTVEEYNRFCDAGIDTVFYKKPEYLRKVEQGPFYVTENITSGWLSMGGIKCDGGMRALDADNKVVEGIFVAGADADIFQVPYYQGGSGNGFSLASGYIAGNSAADFALGAE